MPGSAITSSAGAEVLPAAGEAPRPAQHIQLLGITSADRATLLGQPGRCTEPLANTHLHQWLDFRAVQLRCTQAATLAGQIARGSSKQPIFQPFFPISRGAQ